MVVGCLLDTISASHLSGVSILNSHKDGSGGSRCQRCQHASGASGASSAIKANPGKVFSATETFISTFYVETFPT